MWEVTDAKEVMQQKDSKVLRTRWVIVNKGDSVQYDVRARLVACEVATHKTEDFYASTPPLESKRLLLSELATARVDLHGTPLR